MLRSSRVRRVRRGSIIALCVAFALSFAAAAPTLAQGSVLLQGVADGELWSTSATSNLLTRNGGKFSELARLQLWGAYEPVTGLVFYGQLSGEVGSATRDTSRHELESEQFGIRYAMSRAFVIDAGRLTPIVGTFASRRLSTRNPLIGLPDGYSLNYPYGAEASGETRHFDYRVAMISLPSYHDGYVPSPTARLRPAVGGGVTPMTGLRFGGSYTQGSYLNDGFSSAQLADKSWSSYDQRVLAFDVAYAHGYLETHAEYSRGSYDVPAKSSSVAGQTYYGEAKYTLTPRFFVAARVERNDYPFIRVFGTSWTAKLTDFEDGEVGVGYRLTASTLLKVSARGDRWWVAPYAVGFLGQGGHAIAMQLSQSFDVLSWFEREP
jgi:hypothetical protein